jgi:hypothetical protein
MAWVTPRTWLADQKLAAAQMNEISDALNYLLKPNSGVVTVGAGSSVSSSSQTSWGAVPGLSFNMTTYGGHVLFGMQTYITHSDGSGTNTSYLGVMVDGSFVQALWHYKTNGDSMANAVYLIRNLDPGAHTFALGWRTSLTTYTITLTHTQPVSFVWGVEI